MGKLLSEIIQEGARSSNNFLKDLDMERSTFYKVKSGSRKPTKAQFCEIMRHLKPKGEIRRQLIEEFEMERLWKRKKPGLLLIVREFLRYLNCKQNIRGEEFSGQENAEEKVLVPQCIRDIFLNEMKKENPGRIQIRICPEILDRFYWELSEVRSDVETSTLEIDFLLNNSTEENYDVIRKLRHTETYFYFMKTGKLKISVYRENFSDPNAVRIEDPYPFYLIAGDEMVLIREDLQEYFSVRRESVIQNYRKSFEKRLLHSYTVIEAYDDQEMMQQVLLEQFGRVFRNKGDIYTLSAEVSRLPAMTPQMIRRIFPAELAEWLCQIRQFYVESKACAVVSKRAYCEALNEKKMSEWGEDRELGEKDLSEIREEMENWRKDGKMILIPDYYDYIPDQATLHLFDGEEMFLLMWEHDNILIRIRERELIEGMHKWFLNRMEVEEIENLIGMPDDEEECQDL